MSNELQLTPGIAPTGSTVYAMVFDSTGQAWNTTGTPAFGTFTSTRGDFDIAMTEVSGTGLFRASMVGTAGFRRWQYWLQAGGSPSATADVLLGVGYGWWSGSALVSFSTNTSGGALPTADQIADTTLRRTMASVESSSDGEAVSVGSLYGLVQQAQESSRSGTTLTVKKTDGSTTLGTKTVTVNASANPITGIS